MLPHANVTPVKNPIGKTVLTHDMNVMSLCFSKLTMPVCTKTTEVTHPNNTPSELSAIGK